MSMAFNFGKVGVHSEIKDHAIKVTKPFDHLVLQGHVKYVSCSITITTRPMFTKLGKVVTYYNKLQLTKSHNPLNMWSREVTR